MVQNTIMLCWALAGYPKSFLGLLRDVNWDDETVFLSFICFDGEENEIGMAILFDRLLCIVIVGMRGTHLALSLLSFDR